MRNKSGLSRIDLLNKRVKLIDENGCWKISNHEIDSSVMLINGKAEGLVRAAWIIYKGNIEPGNFVYGTCKGFRNCINPDHLASTSPSEFYKFHFNAKRSNRMGEN